MYKLRNDVPTPPSYRKYPFREMVVGQSFVVTSEDLYRVRAMVQYEQNTGDARFTVRRQGSGYRCWRTD